MRIGEVNGLGQVMEPGDMESLGQVPVQKPAAAQRGNEVDGKLRMLQDADLRDLYEAFRKGQGYKDERPREVHAIGPHIVREYNRRFGNKPSCGNIVPKTVKVGPGTNVVEKLRKLPDADIRGLHAALIKGEGYKDSRPAQVKAASWAIKREYDRRFPAAKEPYLQQMTTASKKIASFGYYSTPDALASLAQIEENTVLMGIGGLGQEIAIRGNSNAMTSIIQADARMNSTVQAANRAKIAAANQSPIAAAKLRQDAQRKSIPGTNVQSQIIGAMNSAADAAKKALARKKQAAAALKANDKQVAAAATIAFIQNGNKAATLATKAEKTRIAIGADAVAKTLEAQASVLKQAADKQIASSGSSLSSSRMLAQASSLNARAAKLRATSATIAQLPDSNSAMVEKRVADLANKYNVRTALQNQMDDQRALMSVLSDISHSAMAQVTDYDGAVQYYGNDLAGRLMADVEYGNVASFLQGLKALDSFGQIDEGLKARADAAQNELTVATGGSVPQQQQQSGGGFDLFKLIGDASKMFQDGSKAVTDGMKTVQNVQNQVQSVAKSVGIPMPGAAKPPVLASKVASAPPLKPMVARALYSPAGAATMAGRAARVSMSEQKVVGGSPSFSTSAPNSAPAGGASGMNMMLVGGVAVAGLAAVFLVPKLMKKSA